MSIIIICSYRDGIYFSSTIKKNSNTHHYDPMVPLFPGVAKFQIKALRVEM